MKLDPGTIAHWSDFAPGHSKFIFILGTNSGGEVLSFTISSQTKYLSLDKTKNDMVEIPYRSTDFLDRPSYIQCFWEVTRTTIAEFRRLENNGTINWRACMPQYIPSVVEVVRRSEILTMNDIDEVLQCCNPRTAP